LPATLGELVAAAECLEAPASVAVAAATAYTKGEAISAPQGLPGYAFLPVTFILIPSQKS
jgi:hypothetical protein